MAQIDIERSPGVPAGELTFEEFLGWADEDTWAEWIDGEVVMMAPAGFRHQRIVGFLLSLLGLYVEKHELGVVLAAPFAMHLPERRQGREPDLLFLQEDHLDRLRDTYLEGPADLVVEVLSPESFARDRGEKFVEYEAAGIPEYWLIDAARGRMEAYRLDGEGRYRPVAPDEEGWIGSEAAGGFRILPDWLFREPLPKVMDAARELGLAD